MQPSIEIYCVHDFFFCFYLQLSNWEPGDRAVSEHQRHYPNCRFVRGERTENVPLVGALTSQMSAGGPALSNVSNPAMQQSEERLLTFVNWPSRIPVRPDQLAKAGFYYVGTFHVNETTESYSRKLSFGPERLAQNSFILFKGLNESSCFLCLALVLMSVTVSLLLLRGGVTLYQASLYLSWKVLTEI